MEIPGAIIIGTAGWEIYKTDPTNPARGESFVHEKFLSLAPQISQFLHKVKNGFFQEIINSPGDREAKGLTARINTAHGALIFERKAQNADLPEGLSQVYNFNQISREKWPEYVDLMIRLYKEHLPPELKGIFDINYPGRGQERKTGREMGKEERDELIRNSRWCGVSFSPYGEEGKEKALIQLFRRENDPKCKPYFRGIPGGFKGAVFFGDSNQDARALRAAHLAAVLAGRRSAGVVVFKTEEPRISSQEKAIRYADVGVKKIKGNAQLLANLAALAERYYHKEDRGGT